MFAKRMKLSLNQKGNFDFDLVCCKFVNNMFELGFDLQDGTKTLAAIIDAYPTFARKECLPRTRRALQGWAKMEPQRTRPPVPWALIAAMCLELLKAGEVTVVGAILLMFTAYLRPGEALHLQRGDLIPPLPGNTHYSLMMHPAERLQQSKVGLSDESLTLDSRQCSHGWARGSRL